MKKKIFIILLFLGLGLNFHWDLFAQHQHAPAKTKQETREQTTKPKKIYRCSMHPQVISDKPGKCPLCGMDLVEVIVSEEEAGKEVSASSVKITPSQKDLIGVQTEAVLKRPLLRMIRTVAKIAYDPELYKTEQEFIQAVKMSAELEASQSPQVAERAVALVEAAALKLKLQGLSEAQIEELKTKSESDRSLLISDSATPYVWVYLTIYEYDLGAIKVGDHIVLETIAYPNEEFSGAITAIDPVLDTDTRSARARAKIDNPEGKLKPNMYGDAFIHLDLGENLAVPKEAVLDTGLRRIVYIDLGKGEFSAAEVEVGQEAIALIDGQERKFFPVLKGLKENDSVVTTGNFLIDSQSQLTGGMSALWGGATEIKQEGQTQHRH